MRLTAYISLTIIRILMAIVKRLNALKLLHASISVRQLLQQWLLQIFKQVGYPLIQILCHPLAAQRASIWPNNKVVTWALGPSLIDLLPGACFSKRLETFQAQRQIFEIIKPCHKLVTFASSTDSFTVLFSKLLKLYS